MSREEKDEWKKNVRYIIQNLSKKQIVETLTSLFELEELPEIIALNRGQQSIKGFAKIGKKIFTFSIAFIIYNNRYTLRLILQFGKQALLKCTEITISKTENRIDIFTTNNGQYLFSVYF